MQQISHVQKEEHQQKNLSQRQQEISCQNSVDVNQLTEYDEASRVFMKKDKFKRLRISFKPLIIIVGGFLLLSACLLYVFHDDVMENIDYYVTSDQTSLMYDLVRLNSTSALCLDGSPGSYYISRDGDPSKIFIYFQGGGWSCGQDESKTLKECYDRSKTPIGSSANLAPTMKTTQGINAKQEHDYFRDWKKVYFSYCDGSGHQGYRKQPVEYQNTKLYFRGHNITIEKFQDLEKRIGLFTKATHVVLSGGSAGGLATFTWTNYLASRIQKAKFYSVPDAGLFYDAQSKKTAKHSYKQCLANLMKFSNAEIDPPVPECMKEFPEAKENCMFAQNLYQHIKVPLMPVQSVYDSWSISNILNLDCIQNGIATCSQDDRNVIEENRRNVTDVLRKIGEDPKNGVWGLGCVRHGILEGPDYLCGKTAIPQHSPFTPGIAVGSWLQNPQKDNVHIDNEPWPGNKPCS